MALTTGDRDLAARLVVGLRGPGLDGDEAAWLEAYQPAGVILFGRNVLGHGQLEGLCRRIRSILGPGAEIVADHEGGPVSVLSAAIGRPPSAAALGRLDDVELTERVHRDTAELMAGVGMTRVLAPCCDVLVEPRNAVIGARSFGADATAVARHTGAAVRGLVAGGLRCCPKHWPGHGGTVLDTHLDGVDRAVERDDPPYVSAVSAGADAMMVGHLPLVDGGPPASFDPTARTELGELISGVEVWSDDITMAGVRPVLSERTGESVVGEGMVDPACYPRSWLAEAGRHGQRLLIRGIPFGALPVDDDLVGPDWAGDDATEVRPDEPESWAEARRRGVAAQLDGDDPIVWLDLTGDHRWGALPADALAAAGHRGRWRRWDDQEPLGPRDCLLVTSHRPLVGSERDRLAIGPGPERCLVLGHPSLGVDLQNAMPSIRWMGKGLDASVEELRAWIGR